MVDARHDVHGGQYTVLDSDRGAAGEDDDDGSGEYENVTVDRAVGLTSATLTAAR